MIRLLAASSDATPSPVLSKEAPSWDRGKCNRVGVELPIAACSRLHAI